MTEGVRPCGFLILKLLGQRVPARIGFIVKVNAIRLNFVSSHLDHFSQHFFTCAGKFNSRPVPSRLTQFQLNRGSLRQ